MDNLDLDRGKELNKLGHLILPITQAIDQILRQVNTVQALETTQLAVISAITRLTSCYVELWERGIPRSINSSAFSSAYSHQVCSPLQWMQSEIAYLQEQHNPMSLDEDEISSSLIEIFRDHVRRIGLLLTAESGIFDESTLLPNWESSLPQTVQVYDPNTQTMIDVKSEEFLMNKSITFSTSNLRWEQSS